MKVKYFKSVFFFSIIIFIQAIGCAQAKDDKIKKENEAKKIVKEIMEMNLSTGRYSNDDKARKKMDLLINKLSKIGKPAIIPILDSLTITRDIHNYAWLSAPLKKIGKPSVKYLCEVWGNEDWRAYNTGLFLLPLIGEILMDIEDPAGIQCIINALHCKNIITKKYAKIILTKALQKSNAKTIKLICDQLVLNGFDKTEDYYYNTSKWIEWINSIPE